jgi:serine/threonine protein kinase
MKGTVLKFSGQFEVICELGEGSFGRVYLVQKKAIGGIVKSQFALKVFKEGVDPQILKAETEALLKARSPHLVSVHSFEEMDGRFALLLEYLDGVTLDELARTSPLDADEIEEVTGQILAGLKELKLRSLRHGDLTPKNIILDRAGRVVLLDFGLSQIFSEDGTVFGNPRYLPQRRLTGATPEISDDLFALELIRYDLLHGLIGKSGPSWFWSERKAKTARPLTPDELFKFEIRLKNQVQARLSQKVELALSLKGESQQTMIHSSTTVLKRWRWGQRALVAGLFFVLLSTPPAPSRGHLAAWISLNALRWIEIQFADGTIIKSNDQMVKVRPGKQVVRWKTAKNSGTMVLEFQPREHKILTESNF